MNRWAWGLVGILGFFGIFFFAPLATFLVSSFRETAGPGRVGAGPTLENYLTIASDPYYRELAFRTLGLSAVSAIGATAIAYPIAYIIARGRERFAAFTFLVVIATLFTSFIIGALGLQIVLSEAGPINFVLQRLGVGPFRLSGTSVAVVIGMIHSTAPLAIIALIPPCERINRNYLSAAYGLGANGPRVFTTVIWPLTRSAVFSVTLLIFAICTGLFVTPLLLGSGRVGVMAIEIRQQILSLLDYPLGAALAVVLLLIVTGITVVALVAARSEKVHGASI